MRKEELPPVNTMKRFITRGKKYVLRGVLVSIPLALSFFVLRFFYIYIDKKITDLVDPFIGFRIPGLGFILFIIMLYLIGFSAHNVFGKSFLKFIEKILSRIPIINTTYNVGKQLSETLSLPEKQVFKRVVLVDYFKPGVWTIGFVTGTILNKKSGEALLKVFIPTVPNPTSGILVILKESQIIDPKWSVEEGMKIVISGGIIGPVEIN